MNKKLFFSLTVLLCVCAVMLVPVLTFAEQLPNPLGEGNVDPRVIIGNIIRAALGIVGSLALIIFIYGGVMMITSAGNEEKVRKGKDMLVWASLGLAVIFASFAIVTFIIGALVGTGTSGPGSLPGPVGNI